jgi:hypothetical protein
MTDKNIGFCLNEVVEVKSAPEISRTLDTNGTLEGLPFMPEMLEYCGKRFLIYKHADKTCVEGYGMHKMDDTVFLQGVRCNGQSHDGCQKFCLIFWKTAWLKKIGNDVQPIKVIQESEIKNLKTKDADKYFCQSTELARATRPLPWWNLQQYINDIKSGQLSAFEIFKHLFITVLSKFQRVLSRGNYVRVRGSLTKTPKEILELREGDWVEVKSLGEIQQTLDSQGRNRGLELSAEMVPYCGKKLKVVARVDKIILEITGLMQKIDGTVLLEGSACDGSFHRGCPRNNYFLWRDIWLKKIDNLK